MQDGAAPPLGIIAAMQKEQLIEWLTSAIRKANLSDTAVPALERPKQAEHGDWATNIALQLAKPLGKNPREVATLLKATLDAQPNAMVSEVSIAGPGFINIRLNPAAKFSVVADALRLGEKFGTSAARKGEKVMVEFVSANPTGPLHTGHARQAALGDTLCNLLETQGCTVHREFYYNDAGNQIDNLARSVQLRAMGVEPGSALWPEDGYRGDYIVEIGKAYLERGGDVNDLNAIRSYAVNVLRNEQDRDLTAFGVKKFDCYYLESSLYTDGRVDKTVAGLKASGHTFEQDGALLRELFTHDGVGTVVTRESLENIREAKPDDIAAFRRQYHIPSDAVVLVKIARLFNLKGHDYVIESARRLAPNYPNCFWLFVGDGILAEPLKKQIHFAGVEDRFRFTGLLTPQQIPLALHASDILVHCSLREGLARVLPQAMLCAKPVVSFDIDGAKEVVNQQTGFLVEPENIDQLTKACEVLIADADLRQRLGQAGRISVRDKFAPHAMVDVIEAVYNTVLKG